MTDIINNILPLILIFALGHGCKRFGLLTKENADLLLKLFFYLILPSIVFLSISRIDLKADLLILPLFAMIMITINFFIATFCRRFFNLSKESTGVFLIGSSITNGAFVYPFTFAMYHEEGLAITYLIDFGNAVITLSFMYFLACRYGSNGQRKGGLYKKFFFSPPLISLCLAFLFNLAGLQLPEVGTNLLRIMGGMTTPLIMLSLGIYFSPRIPKLAPLLTVVGIRILGGLAVGTALIFLFNLTGLTRTIALIMSVSPSAMNTLIYASMEGLDKEFAASIVSYTTLISMIMISSIIVLMH